MEPCAGEWIEGKDPTCIARGSKWMGNADFATFELVF